MMYFTKAFNKIENLSYFVVLACFKSAVGATLLLISWDSMVAIPGNSYFNIALATSLSFTPTIFSKLAFETFGRYNLKTVISTSFFLSSIFIILIVFFSSHYIYFSAIIYFSLWIIYFLIENCCEQWFIIISKEMTMKNKVKFSSLSTSCIQIFTLSGPLFVTILKALDDNAPYVALMIVLLAASAISSFVDIKVKKNQNIGYEKNGKNERDERYEKKIIKNKSLVILALSTIWPCIAMFTMVIPIISNNYYGSSIRFAAFFEILFALSMAFSGHLYPKIRIKKNKIMLSLIFSCSLLSFFFIFFYYADVAFFSLSIFFLGLVFGFCRIEMRAKISHIYSCRQSGSLIASANALSSPLVLLFLGLSYYEFRSPPLDGHILIGLPMTFLISIILFLSAFKKLNLETENGL